METGSKKSLAWCMMGRILFPFFRFRLHLDVERLPAGQPAILVCNHVTNLDPILIGAASPDRPLIYVASEHILRDHPFLRKILYYLFEPISRRKAASAVDTCRKTVRAVRAGKTVCIFAEGETTWNGKTGPVQPGTAVLVKAAGVPLITYRFHGGYFAAPRWGRGLRRGRIIGRITGRWSAEELKEMTAEEVNIRIVEGIREDAFGAQKTEHISYHGRKKNRLAQIDALLFLCPKCKKIGTIQGKGDRLTCSCGLSVQYNACLLPEGKAPFPDFTAWDEWQTNELQKMVIRDPALCISESRKDLNLAEIQENGATRIAARGRLSMDRYMLRIGETGIPVSDIRNMATLQNRKLALSAGDHYYELQAPAACCLRKYLLLWQFVKEETKHPAERKA